MKNIAISTIAMIAFAILALAAEREAEPEAKPAAEVANGDDAKQLEKQITVMGGKEQAPFILKKIDEAEFAKRKAAVPAARIGG